MNGTGSGKPRRKALLGILSLIFGLIAAGSVAMIGLTTFVASFNPPGWLRISTMLPFPFAVIASIGCGATALKRRTSRVWSILGIILAVLATAAFVYIMTTVEY